DLLHHLVEAFPYHADLITVFKSGPHVKITCCSFFHEHLQSSQRSADGSGDQDTEHNTDHHCNDGNDDNRSSDNLCILCQFCKGSCTYHIPACFWRLVSDDDVILSVRSLDYTSVSARNTKISLGKNSSGFGGMKQQVVRICHVHLG